MDVLNCDLQYPGILTDLLLVMISELSDIQIITGNLVDNSMLVIDPSGPIARQVMSQCFRFTNSCKGIALDSLDQVFIRFSVALSVFCQ